MKKRFDEFLPLKLLKMINLEDENTLPYPLIRRAMLADGFTEADIPSESDFIRYLNDKSSFLMQEAEPKYSALNEFIARLAPKLLSPTVWKRCESGMADPRTELKDLLLAPELWKRWSLSKQVYQPDPDFASALLRTDSLQLTRSQIKHLPVQDFYVDLTGQAEFAPIIGGLVSVTDYPTHAAITVYLLTEKLEYFSHYAGGEYDEHDMITLPILKEEAPYPADYDVLLPNGGLKHYTDIGLSRRKTALLCMQILCYLTSREPDIMDSPRTSKTYRPIAKGVKPKQKWSEVQIHDVGVRIGSTIRLEARKAKEQLQQENTDTEDNTEENSDENTKADAARKPRKSPVPHFRRAHWQRFWTGKGRTVCEVLWCAPTFVGHGETDLVLHRMEA